MPALCSTIRTLEKLAKDDVSSMAILGRSIMHDNALTSRILRVANSAIYNKGISPVTTVSRAAVVLGFDTIRNICITAKLLSSLLESKNLAPSVYQRLLKLMAQAFQAAMLAKMMLDGYDEELQEEAFIAALLYHLGESAFWSTGAELAEVLDSALSAESDAVNRLNLVREALGASFNQLSQGLARSWGLGELLCKSLSNPDERTPEIRSIFLANKLSEALAGAALKPEELERRLKQAADMLQLDTDEFRGRVLHCSNATVKLAEAYGAKVLIEYLPDTDQLLPQERVAEVVVREANLAFQLKKLRELTGFAVEKTDFNKVVTTALEGILEGIGLDRCAVLLLSPSRRMLQPRIALGDGAEEMKNDFILELEGRGTLLRDCIENQKLAWQGEGADKAVLGEQLARKVPASGFMLAPLKVDNKVIGVYYADKASSGRDIHPEDFDSFGHFVQLANICFSVAFRH
ncbi:MULTISPECIES: HDOD domain-containing protein [Shewanella]|uniref:HDOD domain-containing protein n=1 Tax=Shewanella algae TaxID=38313 RepID=UPI001AADB027|nr:HDOD domain-containing protein [Shewanella algae]QTE92846.1 HDOD domain-containing protein [Shewanella algae]